jgi:hypothetical protein
MDRWIDEQMNEFITDKEKELKNDRHMERDKK